MKIERICVVYGDKETIENFLEVNQMAFEESDSKIECIEFMPKTDWFKEIKKGILKGFEE